VIVGPKGVGKSTFLHCLQSGKSPDHSSRPALDADLVVLQVEPKNSGRKFVLKAWDTTGQEEFESLPSSLLRRADIILMMYEAGKPEFKNWVENWSTKIKEEHKSGVQILMACMKADILSKEEANKHKHCFTKNKPGQILDFVSNLVHPTSS